MVPSGRIARRNLLLSPMCGPLLKKIIERTSRNTCMARLASDSAAMSEAHVKEAFPKVKPYGWKVPFRFWKGIKLFSRLQSHFSDRN